MNAMRNVLFFLVFAELFSRPLEASARAVVIEPNSLAWIGVIEEFAVLVWSDGEVLVLDDTGAETTRGKLIDFAGGGTPIVSGRSAIAILNGRGRDAVIEVYQIPSVQLVTKIKVQDFGGILAGGFSRDGKTLAVASTLNQKMCWIEISTGHTVSMIDYNRAFSACNFIRPNDTEVVIGVARNTGEIVDKTGRVNASVNVSPAIFDLAIGPNVPLDAFPILMPTRNLVQRIDLESGTAAGVPIRLPPKTDWTLAVTPDLRRWAISDGALIRVSDQKAGLLLQIAADDFRPDMLFTPQGERLLVVAGLRPNLDELQKGKLVYHRESNLIRCFDISLNKEVWRYDGDAKRKQSGPIPKRGRR